MSVYNCDCHIVWSALLACMAIQWNCIFNYTLRTGTVPHLFSNLLWPEIWLISTLAAVPNTCTCTCYCNRFCSQCPIVFIRLSLSLAQTFYLWRLPNIMMNSEVSEWSIFSKNIENFRNPGALPLHPRGGPRPLDPRRGHPRLEPPSIQSWLRAWHHLH